MTIDVSPSVAEALAAGQPAVALESTILCHGIPKPRNQELAVAIEEAVRAAGAVPATTAVIDGRIKVGLAPAEFERLLTAADVAKCSTRDLPRLLTCGGLGATTVAATMFVAARVGIRIMATGGLGGVHQGGERTLDVSADLEELARTRVTVCAAASSRSWTRRVRSSAWRPSACRWSAMAATSCPGSIHGRDRARRATDRAPRRPASPARDPPCARPLWAWWWYNRRRATTRCPGCGSSGWSKRRVRRPAPAGCAARHSRRSCCNTWRSTARAPRFGSTARLPWPMRAWRPSCRARRRRSEHAGRKALTQYRSRAKLCETYG